MCTQHTRNVYLKKKTLEEARKILFKNFTLSGVLKNKTVSVSDAVGRVLSEPVFAKISSPNFHAAAMDGIAVNASDTFGASETVPKELAIGKNAFFINTGNIIDKRCNAVIMIENVNIIDDGNRVVIESPAFPWQHVRKMGEDIVATEILFPQNHLITPYCIGALITGGIFSVSVKKKPKVLIIPTGSELYDWDNTIKKNLSDNFEQGQVIESNSYVLGKLIELCGGSYQRNDIICDDVNKIQNAVSQGIANDYDIVLIIGGSSAGSEDYAKKVIEKTGKVYVHGVTIMPGKPVIIGSVNNKPVFGIPGYPVSAIIVFEQFVRPIICSLLGQSEEEKLKIQATPTKKIASKLGVEEFLRVKLGQVGEKIVAMLLPRGAGCITSITEADGIIRIPNHLEGIQGNQPVTTELLRPLSSIIKTIVVVGSHDNTLDILSDQIKAKHNSITLSSSHVGSMGGIMAIKTDSCHVAGSHLIDTDDGSYNISYIKKYLPDINIRLVNLVYREQGLIVPKGNPKKIKSISDICRDDITIINRQIGSGTRILLDFKLKQNKIDKSKIKGYENDEYTHMSVAVSILSKTADTGLGIYAAAKALDLDFIPIITEQYDLIIPEKYFESENIRIFIETIKSTDFKKRVEALGGYNTKNTGKQIWHQSL